MFRYFFGFFSAGFFSALGFVSVFESDEVLAASAFLSACLASCLSAPDSADSRNSRLRRLVP
ncbi:MAG: hypothetical protein JWQ20_3835 [Conexibacter sp.]|nr:hypothetical protein [Conexibacter sp.]